MSDLPEGVWWFVDPEAAQELEAGKAKPTPNEVRTSSRERYARGAKRTRCGPRARCFSGCESSQGHCRGAPLNQRLWCLWPFLL